MVLTFIAGFAATFGTAEGIRAAQGKSRREEHRSRKNNLVVHCTKGSKYSGLLEGRGIVLAGDKLYIDTGTEYNVPFGHPFEGYFLPYPDRPFAGLVSTTTHAAPIMNWVFVHRETHEVRYGTRAPADANLPGPWDVTRQDRRLTFGGWEGFCAAREGAFWALYFDVDGDRLARRVAPGTPVVELGVLRTEMRVKRPEVVEGGGQGGEPAGAARERAEVAAREQAEVAAKEQAKAAAKRQADDEPRGPRRSRGQPKSPRPPRQPPSPRRQEQPKPPRQQQGASAPGGGGGGKKGRRKGRSSNLPSPGSNNATGIASDKAGLVP